MFRRIALLAVAAAALATTGAAVAATQGARIIGGGDDMEILREASVPTTRPATLPGEPALLGGGDDLEIIRR